MPSTYSSVYYDQYSDQFAPPPPPAPLVVYIDSLHIEDTLRVSSATVEGDLSFITPPKVPVYSHVLIRGMIA